MARLPRNLLPDGYFHVTSRGTGGIDVFSDDDDRKNFIRRLVGVAAQFEWACHAYCLMTTHYHLIIACTRSQLSLGMHRLNGGHALRFNSKYGRFGHLFQARFDARAIDSEAYLAAACEYVIQNPVRAGLCASASDWPWGDYGAPTACA